MIRRLYVPALVALAIALGAACGRFAPADSGECAHAACGCFPVDCGGGRCCDSLTMACSSDGKGCEYVGPPVPGPNGEFRAKRDDAGGAR